MIIEVKQIVPIFKRSKTEAVSRKLDYLEFRIRLYLKAVSLSWLGSSRLVV